MPYLDPRWKCMRSACVRLRRRKWELRKLCGCWSERVTEEGSERQNCRPLEWQGQPWGKDIGRKSLEESKGESRQHWRGPNPCSLPLMKVISHIPMHDNDVCKCNDTRAHTHTCTFTHACPSCKIARGFLYLIQTNSGSLAAWFLHHMTNRATLCLFFHRLTFSEMPNLADGSVTCFVWWCHRARDKLYLFSLCEHNKYSIIGCDKPRGGFEIKSHAYLAVE